MEDDVTNKLLTASQVRERFGNISDMSLWRWIKSPVMGFPQPIRINGRRFFRLQEIEAFEMRASSGRQ